jgi:hypothetical protein
MYTVPWLRAAGEERSTSYRAPFCVLRRIETVKRRQKGPQESVFESGEEEKEKNDGWGGEIKN